MCYPITSCIHTLCCLCAPAQVAGQGRGLFAARDLEYGEVLFSEQPYLCAPALSKRKQVCYHCLKVLGKGQAGEGLPTRAAAAQGGRGSRAFCSDSCLSAAQHSYYQLESQLNLGQLEQYCEAHGERFPLLAARWARRRGGERVHGQQLAALGVVLCVKAGMAPVRPLSNPFFPVQPAHYHHQALTRICLCVHVQVGAHGGAAGNAHSARPAGGSSSSRGQAAEQCVAHQHSQQQQHGPQLVASQQLDEWQQQQQQAPGCRHRAAECTQQHGSAASR